jgi:hypothetical protein
MNLIRAAGYVALFASLGATITLGFLLAHGFATLTDATFGCVVSGVLAVIGWITTLVLFGISQPKD